MFPLSTDMVIGCGPVLFRSVELEMNTPGLAGIPEHKMNRVYWGVCDLRLGLLNDEVTALLILTGGRICRRD
jgi:hypothetical protein